MKPNHLRRCPMKIRHGSWSVHLNSLHGWRRRHLKFKFKKSAFKEIFLQNCKHFNTLLYPLTAKYHANRISHCPDTFSSGDTSLNILEIWLRLLLGEHLLYIRAKMTSFVNSLDWHVAMVCLFKKDGPLAVRMKPFNMMNSGTRLIRDWFKPLYPLEEVSTLQNMGCW